MRTVKQPKLIIIDCDGVLYNPSELNVNEMLWAFNVTCEKFNIVDEKFDIDANFRCNKPIGGMYNHITSVAKKANITPKIFLSHIIANIDYSHLTPDTDNMLDLFYKLSKKYKVCICTNNHLSHLNIILKAKFGITTKQLPFEVFSATFAKQGGIYYPKQSDIFIKKLEKHFGVNVSDFLWIDDDTTVTDAVTDLGSQFELVTPEYSLKDILHKILR